MQKEEIKNELENELKKMNNSLRRINELLGIETENKTNKTNEVETVTVTEILHYVGMPSNLSGFWYTRDAILMVIKDVNVLRGITKNIYPDIAKKYKSSPSRVERAIRHAVEVAWSRGDTGYIDTIFGYTVDIKRGKPSNSEFIASLADYINNYIK